MQTALHIKLSSRLSFNERRQAIIESVKDVFAKAGFDGTTSRELAKAAGISEALLYKYFPTKLSLYNAMLSVSVETADWLVSNHGEALKPSTATLIMMVDSLVSQVVESRSVYLHYTVLGRLAVRSLLEDGAFVRALLQMFANNWVAVFEKSLEGAVASGDLRECPGNPDLCAWLVYHIAFGLMLHFFPNNAAIDYKVPKETLIEQAVHFALRGLGLKDETIKRYYHPKSLRLLAE